VKIERALAVAARARIRRRIDSALQSDSKRTSSERPIVLRDVRGRFVKGHAGGPGRPPLPVSGKALPATYLRSGDDTAGRRCGNSAKRIRDHICGL
jgi:hypothetical protein